MGDFYKELRSLIGNEGGFIHKKLLGIAGGAVKGFITGGPTGALAGGIKSLTSTPRPTVSRTVTARPSLAGAQGKEFGRQLKLGNGEPAGGFRVGNGNGLAIHRGDRGIVAPVGVHEGRGPCLPPLVRNDVGQCVAPTSPLGARTLVGEAIMGRYGAALIPGSQIVDRATCLRGMQLGNDGLCYNKGQITNKQRMWPAGRKPLLTGGDMRAISVASRAGRRMELATKRLQKMGMMKKPTRRIAAPRGHVARLEHAS